MSTKHLTRTFLRTMALSALILWAVGPSAFAQDGGSSGLRWRIFETTGAAAGAAFGKAGRKTWVVFPASAVDELQIRGILPVAEAQEIRDDLEADGRDYREVDDLFVVHLEAARMVVEKAAGPSDGERQSDPKGCFSWGAEKTYSGRWSESHPGDLERIHVDRDGIVADVEARMPFHAELEGTVIYRIKKKLCLPYKVRLVTADMSGTVTVNGGGLAVSADFDLTAEWNWEHHVHTFTFDSVSIGPLKLRFKLPIDVGMSARVNVAGKLDLRAEIDGTVGFDVHCTTSGCEGPTHSDYDFVVADPVYDVTLDADARLWVRAAARAELELIGKDLAFGSVGATGFVQAQLFGLLSNQCGDWDGDGAGDRVEGLLFDLDVGYRIDARVGGLLVSDQEWILLEDQEHLYFRDLLNGSSVLDVLVTGPQAGQVGETMTYRLETRPCYPYSDDIMVVWEGPFPGTGSLTPRIGSLDASGLPAAGDHTLLVTMVRDTHGRDLGAWTSWPVSVTHPAFDRPDAKDGFGHAVAGGDFNCDGYDDLAVGVPWKDFESAADTGLVTVSLADPSGGGLPSMAEGRLLYLFHRPVAADAAPGARFGHRLAVGDFNGDSCDDLAVSAPWDRGGAGTVQVLYGSAEPGTLLAEREEIFLADGATDDHLGDHMAAGDLDGDGSDELAMTLPGKNGGAGAVLVADGGTGKETLIDQDSPGVPGVAEAGDGSGMSVAIGDFDGDGDGDLAIGFPDEDHEARDDGFVVVLHGTSDGLATPGNDGFGQGELAGGGGETDGGRFGWALATGDFDGDGYADLAVSSPEKAWDGTARTGIVQVVKGSDKGLRRKSGVQLLHQSRLGVELADPSLFGGALRTGDMNGDGYADLAIGAYAKSQLFDDPETGLLPWAGETYVAYGRGDGTFDVPKSGGSTDGHVFSRATPGFEGPRSPRMQTGFSLGAADFDGDGSADLIVCSFGSTVDGQAEAGSCNVLYGHPTGLSTFGSLYLEQNRGVSGAPGDGGEGGQLTNGGAETGLSGNTDSHTRYAIEVPVGATDLSFTLSGGSGDADLYVRFGSAPTTSAYDCRSWRDGNDESCSLPTPKAGTYHVLIHGYDAYSGATLVASYKEPDKGGCGDSVNAAGLSGGKGAELRSTLDVDACASTVTVTLSGGTGDPDLYVRFGSQPTTSLYDCRSWEDGTGETCTFTPSQAGTYHILVHGYSAFSEVTLSASYE